MKPIQVETKKDLDFFKLKAILQQPAIPIYNNNVAFQEPYVTKGSYAFKLFKEQSMKNYMNFIQQVLMILDNAPVHTSRLIREKVLKNMNHLFLPPYSPELNPIELYWHFVKYKLSKSTNSTEENFFVQLHNYLSSAIKEYVSRFCGHVYNYVEKALNKIPF